MKARVWIILVLLAGMMMAGADKPEGVDGKKAGGKEAKWISLAPAREGMGSWKALNFGGEGDTVWKGGTLTIEEGAELTGVVFSGGNLPEAPYEIEVAARRTSGVDFFCGLTLIEENGT